MREGLENGLFFQMFRVCKTSCLHRVGNASPSVSMPPAHREVTDCLQFRSVKTVLESFIFNFVFVVPVEVYKFI